MKNALKLLTIGAAMAAASTMAFGSTLTLNSFSSADAGGTVVASIPTSTMTALTFTANYSQTVYVGGTNSECATCLTFVYTFNTLTAHPSNDGPDHLSSGLLSGDVWASFNPVVGYVASSGTYAPTGSNDDVPTAIDFNYSQNIGIGHSSDTLVIETNATSFSALMGTFTADDTSSADVLVYAPVGPTPEPSSLALLGTGLLGAAGIARRRFMSR